ncbi:MAG: hypothetical protein NC331_01880 [Lachnospiraceae bacterium]|nr:hypothetical protein [Lachnospiraceae bacterium]MCM1238116.1 hypothetical protein [Lachnospiraceae bacterium]
MSNTKASDRIAAHVGISAPETPKYLLANNFLLEYFEQAGENLTLYNYNWFERNGVLSTQDSQNKEKLEEAFNRFLERYLGDETIHNENNRLKKEHHFYFPLTQDMLVEGKPTLRHVLFHLQSLDTNFQYEKMQQDLKRFLFSNHSGIDDIWKILFQKVEDVKLRKRDVKQEDADFWNMLKPVERNRMRKLGERLNEDLHILLTQEFFTELDFYRKYQYLSILLTSYVIQYILARKGGNACILCKGRPFDDRLNGDIHRACCYSYTRLRDVFPDLLKAFYREALEPSVGKAQSLHLSAQKESLLIQGKSFDEVMKDISGRNQQSLRKVTYEKLLQGFAIEDGDEKDINVDEFVMRFTDLIGSKQGSSLQKMSSILSTSGKQIDMVYPKTNVNSKYFAMSEGLAEFYVRLYLARKGLKYDYLDNFLDDLLERYTIIITKTGKSEKYLKIIKPLLKAQELMKNKQAFLDTLNSGNCLIKLSDSGFVITLPEEKGGFKLI